MRSLVIAFGALALAGCSADLHGGVITDNDPVVGGIPYRVRENVTVEVYQLTDKGYQKVGSSVENLADPTKLYFLNFKGGTLANANAKFEQRADGTLSTVHLAGKTQATATINAVADAYSGYATQRQADSKAKADQAAKVLAAQDAEAQKGDTLVDLTYKAKIAEAKLGELPTETKESDRIETERVAVEAKRAANAAALKAGQPPPFPGV